MTKSRYNLFAVVKRCYIQQSSPNRLLFTKLNFQKCTSQYPLEFSLSLYQLLEKTNSLLLNVHSQEQCLRFKRKLRTIVKFITFFISLYKYHFICPASQTSLFSNEALHVFIKLIKNTHIALFQNYTDVGTKQNIVMSRHIKQTYNS